MKIWLDDKYVSEDNPYEAHIDQENYLIAINDTRLHYIELGDNFYISPNYKNVYRIKDKKKIPIKILANSRILEGSTD